MGVLPTCKGEDAVHGPVFRAKYVAVLKTRRGNGVCYCIRSVIAAMPLHKYSVVPMCSSEASVNSELSVPGGDALHPLDSLACIETPNDLQTSLSIVPSGKPPQYRRK